MAARAVVVSDRLAANSGGKEAATGIEQTTLILSQATAELEDISRSIKEIRASGSQPDVGLLARQKELSSQVEELTAERNRLLLLPPQETTRDRQDQLSIELQLTNLEIKYINEYIFPRATKILEQIAAAAFTLPPVARLQALRDLLPTLNALPVDPAVLQASPKIKDLPNWEQIFSAEISAEPQFMLKKAERLNLEAISDIRDHLGVMLQGTDDEIGIIPALEHAIASAAARFGQTRAELSAEAMLEARMQRADDLLGSVDDIGILNEDECEHYTILLRAYADKLQVDIAAAQVRFDQVTQAFPANANIATKLAAVVLAQQQIPGLNIVEADELTHYTFLINSLADKLRGHQATADGRFAQVVQSLQAIESRQERWQVVKTAIDGIAALNIADTDDRAHYAALLNNLAGTLQAAVQAAEKSLAAKFNSLIGMEHLTEVRKEAGKFSTEPAYVASIGDIDTQVHYFYLLKESCHSLERSFKMALTSFAQNSRQSGTMKARLAAQMARLVEQERALAIMLSAQRESAPRLLQVVEDAVAREPVMQLPRPQTPPPPQ